ALQLEWSKNPQPVTQHYADNLTATIGIISVIDRSLAKHVRAFLKQRPSAPALASEAGNEGGVAQGSGSRAGGSGQRDEGGAIFNRHQNDHHRGLFQQISVLMPTGGNVSGSRPMCKAECKEHPFDSGVRHPNLASKAFLYSAPVPAAETPSIDALTTLTSNGKEFNGDSPYVLSDGSTMACGPRTMLVYNGFNNASVVGPRLRTI
ncbi:hypothetical protein B0H16DRAFT_1481064, partial [Mycena metata]